MIFLGHGHDYPSLARLYIALTTQAPRPAADVELYSSTALSSSPALQRSTSSTSYTLPQGLEQSFACGVSFWHQITVYGQVPQPSSAFRAGLVYFPITPRGRGSHIRAMAFVRILLSLSAISASRVGSAPGHWPLAQISGCVVISLKPQ